MTHKLVGVINGLATLWLGASLLIFGMLAFDDEVAAGRAFLFSHKPLSFKHLTPPAERRGEIFGGVAPFKKKKTNTKHTTTSHKLQTRQTTQQQTNEHTPHPQSQINTTTHNHNKHK